MKCTGFFDGDCTSLPPPLAVNRPFDKAVNRVADAGILACFIDLAANLS